MRPFAQSVLNEFKEANKELRKSLQGLRGDALNWRPFGEQSTSLYALAVHMIGAQRFWTAVAAGKTVERSRPAEFAAMGDDPAPILASFDRVEAELEEWLSSMALDSLEHPRPVPRAFANAFGPQVTAAFCLSMLLRHSGEHAGHAAITRQLWDQRAAQTR